MSEVCVTWSIGFRAPTNQELLETWLDDVRDSISVAGRVTDEVRDQSRMSLKPTNSTNHAAIASALSSQVADTISRAIATTLTPRALAEFTGRYFTQAKSHVVFDLPEKELLQAAFIKRACKDGLVLDLRTRMLHDQSTIYVNGDMFVVDKKGHTLFAQFANSRVLDSDILKSATSDAVEALYAQWVRGYWHFYN
jgi:50S ribosomal protein L16 3-hydroxylase